MTRTRPLPLVVLAAIGVAGAFLLDLVLAMQGRPVLVPPVSLIVALLLIAAALVGLAWPVRRAAKGERRVDPFYAMRILVLAKACALGAALLTGVGAGILVYLLSRSVVPIGSSVTAAAMLVAAAALLVAALVAEHFCSLPPEDEAEDEAAAAAS
ncbi:DUF3180 domain-containing protein [Microcella daejeonensis]|uniref:DUF3180 domain-containing protein n=1 Tax=Microcella daejeonensis TaxID=2994971 RepID=A0A9E8S9K7_9MICO|nr:DUF3180 domain-containing protein [Microcella daejeonensis]WAB82129.1 DUF3180 domain-containing protein [Microcella daejeonensis]